MDRKQFTFYESFASALARIKSKTARCDAYDAICKYALYGREPDMDSLPDAAAIAFDLIRPTLDTSARKSANGKAGGKKQTASKPEANAKQTVSEKEGENEVEVENEVENEKEVENECSIPLSSPKKATSFDRFWEAYPKKVGKELARKSFSRVHVPLETLLDAIEKQKASAQWQTENGRFIPYPATWLNQGRWEDEVIKPSVGNVSLDYGDDTKRIAEARAALKVITGKGAAK